jgi:hypothetical protein
MTTRSSIGARTRFDVFKRDNFTCVYCGGKTPTVILEVDHVVAVAEGGTNDLSNLVTSCFECNRGKGAVPIDRLPESIDMHENAIAVAERELQIREYNEVVQRARLRLEADVRALQDHWASYYRKSRRDDDYLLPSVLRAWLREFVREELLQFITDAVERTNNQGQARRYLIGIVRNQREQRGGG